MDEKNYTDERIVELQRLIDKFRSDFRKGTSEPNNFMSMSDIERLWKELINETDKIYLNP